MHNYASDIINSVGLIIVGIFMIVATHLGWMTMPLISIVWGIVALAAGSFRLGLTVSRIQSRNRLLKDIKEANHE